MRYLISLILLFSPMTWAEYDMDKGGELMLDELTTMCGSDDHYDLMFCAGFIAATVDQAGSRADCKFGVRDWQGHRDAIVRLIAAPDDDPIRSKTRAVDFIQVVFDKHGVPCKG